MRSIFFIFLTVIARCKGRIEGEHGAAHLLAVHANTLRSRMHKLGIRWERFR